MTYATQTPTRVRRLRLPQGIVEACDETRAPSFPEGIRLAFCPTGEGGGVDPTCSPGGANISFAPDTGGSFGFGSGLTTGSPKWQDKAEKQMVKLAKQRDAVKASIKEAKASGDTSGLGKLKKERAALNKELEKIQKVMSKHKASSDDEDGSPPTPKVTKKAEIEDALDSQSPVKESCCIDSSVKPSKGHMQYVDKLHKDYCESLSGRHASVIDQYTGSGFEGINRNLRRGKVQDRVKVIDEIIDKAPAIDKEVVAHRAFSGNFMSKLKTGDVFEDKAFVSTSMKPGGAFSANYKANTKQEGVEMRIRIPKGSKGLYVDRVSSHRGEWELLLPRGSRFKIEGVRTRTVKSTFGFSMKTVRTVQVTLLPPK